MFSSMKMEEYMEYDLFGIFPVKLIAKNIVLGPPRTILCIYWLSIVKCHGQNLIQILLCSPNQLNVPLPYPRKTAVQRFS